MRFDQLLARIADKDLRAVATKAAEIAERFDTRRQSIEGDARFNEFGRREALSAELQSDFAPALRLAKMPLRGAQEAIDARKASIKLPAIDPTDIVAQLQRMERRAHVAALDPTARTALLFDAATDKRIVDAVLADAPELSGLPSDRYGALLKSRLLELHGPEMAAVERDEESLSAADAVVAVVTQQMKTAFPDGQRFDKLMESATIPWLKDLGGGFIACIKIGADGKGSYPRATEAELKSGRYYTSIEEYNAQQAA